MKRGLLGCRKGRINTLSSTEHRIWKICGDIIMKSKNRCVEPRQPWEESGKIARKMVRSPREHGPGPKCPLEDKEAYVQESGPVWAGLRDRNSFHASEEYGENVRRISSMWLKSHTVGFPCRLGLSLPWRPRKSFWTVSSLSLLPTAPRSRNFSVLSTSLL